MQNQAGNNCESDSGFEKQFGVSSDVHTTSNVKTNLVENDFI